MRGHVPEIEEVWTCAGKNWAADPYSRGGQHGYRPGQLTGLLARRCKRRGAASPSRAADIASGWVGYMDGAIESGIRAARAASRALAADLKEEERDP